jgi:hypothetical protein
MTRAAIVLLAVVAGCGGAVGTASSVGDAGVASDVPSPPAADAALRDATAPAVDAGPLLDATVAASETAAPPGVSSASDAKSFPDGAIVIAGQPLAACHWPASLTPPIPDGSYAEWSVSRTVLSCGAGVTGGGPGAEFCGSDNGVVCSGGGVGGIQYSPCVLGCAPDQYAVTSAIAADPGPNFPQDAAVLGSPLPSGCVGTLAGFVLQASSAGPPSIACCPCE